MPKPLTLTYRQAQALMERVDTLRQGFSEPIPNPELSASFERGALAALDLVDDIIRTAMLEPESHYVLPDGAPFSETQFAVRVE